MRRTRTRQEPEISNTLLVFLSRGLRGDPATVNPFEALEYEFPNESIRAQLESLRSEIFKNLSAAEKAEFVRREVEAGEED